MAEKIFEIRIVRVDQMPEQTKEIIARDVAKRPQEFINKYKGYAKITYATASAPKIIDIEPIEGTIIDYMKSIREEGVDFSVF